MECKREKSNTTVIILQIVLSVLYTVEFVFVIITIGLFGKAQQDLQKSPLFEEKLACLLFLEDGKVPRASNCNYVFAGEVLTATGLVVLLILSIIKILCGLMKNNAFLAIDVILLTVTVIFAVSAMIVLCAGWAVTCITYEKIGYDCGNFKFYNTIIGAAVFSGLVCITAFVRIVVYIVTTVVSRK